MAGQPESQAAGPECTARGVRVRVGPSLGPPGHRTECPPARRAGSGQNVRGDEVGLPGAGAVSGSGDRMSLAEWHVHLPGSAYPAAACVVGFAAVGCLKPHFANLFLLLGLWGSGARSESKACSWALGRSSGGCESLSNSNQVQASRRLPAFRPEQRNP